LNHKRNERRLYGATLKTNRLQRTLRVFSFLQPFQLVSRNGEKKAGSADVFHQQDERHCTVCNVLVDNSNLGGHSRKSGVGRGSLVSELLLSLKGC
jgi:hypothetical protein